MADPLTIVGGLAAGLQLAKMAGQAVLATIKLMQDLSGVPAQLTRLLSEVDDSIFRLCCSCSAGSKAFEKLDQTQLERLSRIAGALHPALREIHNMLTPLANKQQSKRRYVGRLWMSMVSLKIEKDLSGKLVTLNRLNVEMIRELGVLGLEVQLTTKGLVMANNAASSDGFSNLESKMDALRSDFHEFTISVQQTHDVTLERPSSQQASSSEQEPSEDGRQVRGALSEPTERVRHYLATHDDITTSPGLQRLSSNQLPCANLEFLLFSIRTFYTIGNFDASPVVLKMKFWEDTDLAIYLMKIARGQARGSSQSEIRGFRLLKNSTADAPAILNQGRTTAIIELLSTLSPVNTTACPHVRAGVLSYLNELAREHLPTHPIALVIKTLMGDNGDGNISIRALTSIAERLRTSLGPTHHVTQLATKRLCSLLRRSGDYLEALRVAGDSIHAIRALLGPDSLHERRLLRGIEHVHMDQKDWTSALSVCFTIVGQKRLDTTDPDPTYHDDCAIYTMEDISKACESAGNLELAVAWLKQARISSGMLWGNTDAVAHIQDKLVELLRQMGRRDELELWTVMLGFPCST